MNDFILKSEATEHLSNRQTAKILFLQQELHQAQETIKDLQYILKLNKEYLILATDPKTKKNLNEEFYDENIRLVQRVDSLMKERNIAQSRALINQQIAEDSESRIMELENEMEEKIHELRRIIQDKEFTIQELEKIKPQLNKEGILIKYREIINPSEQVLKIQNENVNLIRNLGKITKSSQDLEERNKKLKEKNFLLKSELLKMKMVLQNNANFYRLKSYYLDHTTLVSEDEATFVMPTLEKFKAEISKKPNPNQKKKPLKKSTHYSLQIENLETEIKSLKELLSLQSTSASLVFSDMTRLSNELATLSHSHTLLLTSYSFLQDKCRRLRLYAEFYKEFFYDYLTYLESRSRRSWTPPPDPIFKYLSSGFQEKMKEVNVSILDEEGRREEEERKDEEGGRKRREEEGRRRDEEDGKRGARRREEGGERRESIMEEDGLTKVKNFWLEMGRDLYGNENVRRMLGRGKGVMKGGEGGCLVLKLKRSMSNPIDYVGEEGRERIYRWEEGKRKRRFFMKNRDSNSKKKNGMGVSRPLFCLDVSKIVPENLNLELSFDGARANDFILFEH